MYQRGLDWNHANYNRDNMKVLIETILTNADLKKITVDFKSQKLQDHDEFEDIPELIPEPIPKLEDLGPHAMEFETLLYPGSLYGRRH